MNQTSNFDVVLIYFSLKITFYSRKNTVNKCFQLKLLSTYFNIVQLLMPLNFNIIYYNNNNE